RDEHVEAGVGRVTSRVLDRHVRPGSCNDDGFNTQAVQQNLELCAEEPVHTNLLNDEVSAHWLQPLDRGSTPGSSNKGVHVLHTLEKGRVQLQSHCSRFHDVVDMDDGCPWRRASAARSATFAPIF